MKYLTFLVFLFTLSNLYSQDFELYEKESFVFENDTLNYRILEPLNYNPSQKYPVHLVLHGSGERGNDNSSQLTHGGVLFLKKQNREKYNWKTIYQLHVSGGHKDRTKLYNKLLPFIKIKHKIEGMKNTIKYNEISNMIDRRKNEME